MLCRLAHLQVMDDNRTLTLVNGDRIGMSDGMCLLFEVQDLSSATPATVSRAGGYQPARSSIIPHLLQ